MSADFAELLNTFDFKTHILGFHFKEYEDPIYGPIIGEKVFYCYKTMFQFEEVHELYGNHLEDYTRVMFHVNHADKNGNGNTINTNGNTIAVILTCNAK